MKHGQEAGKGRALGAFVGRIFTAARHLIPAAAATVVRRLLGRSDISRWQERDSLSPKWDSRTKRLAELVPPGASVLEFGAGRMVMRDHLPPSCTYVPSDLTGRGEGTLVYDLNSSRPPNLPCVDVVAMSGVLEYVNDPPRLVAVLASTCETVIMSYAATELPGAEATLQRRSNGWVNDYSSADLEALFSRSGFSLTFSETFGDQLVLVFSRATGASGADGSEREP